MISEQLPYSPGLVLGEEGGGVNARDMGGVSVRRRDIPYLRFPPAIRALALQTTHHAGSHLTSWFVVSVSQKDRDRPFHDSRSPLNGRYCIYPLVTTGGGGGAFPLPYGA